MNIRLAQPHDAAQVYEVFKQTWLDTYPNREHDITVDDILSRYPAEKVDATIQKYKDFYQKLNSDLESVDTIVWVAEKFSNILGLITINKVVPTQLGALYVLPQFQGTGVGKKLIEFVLEKYGAAEMQVNVAKYNHRAIKFYQKYGFEIVGDIDDASGKLPTGKIIPEIKMIRAGRIN